MAVLISCALADWLDEELELSDDELSLLADPLLLLQAASMAAETRPMPNARASRAVGFMNCSEVEGPGPSGSGAGERLARWRYATRDARDCRGWRSFRAASRTRHGRPGVGPAEGAKVELQ